MAYSTNSHHSSARLQSTPSLPSTPSGSSLSGAIENGAKFPFLWRNIARRPNYKAVGENKLLMSEVRHVMQATILTGKTTGNGHFNIPLWPDLHHELALSELIENIWRERRAIRVEEDRGMGRSEMPTELPIPEEARQVCHRTSCILSKFSADNFDS
jgi:hypothetical protein